MVFLNLFNHEAEQSRDVQIHFFRPTGVKKVHVFKILIHLDVVEYLMFCHYPQEELLAFGKTPWSLFVWHFGCPDRDSDDDDGIPSPRLYTPTMEPRWHPRDDEDDRDHKRSQACGILRRASSWLDRRGRSKNRPREGAQLVVGIEGKQLKVVGEGNVICPIRPLMVLILRRKKGSS
jgi:hypothetical protein